MRKDWLIADSVDGAQASVKLYSLIETANANEMELYAYVRRVLTELPAATSIADTEALLPFQGKDDSEPAESYTPCGQLSAYSLLSSAKTFSPLFWFSHGVNRPQNSGGSFVWVKPPWPPPFLGRDPLAEFSPWRNAALPTPPAAWDAL